MNLQAKTIAVCLHYNKYLSRYIYEAKNRNYSIWLGLTGFSLAMKTHLPWWPISFAGKQKNKQKVFHAQQIILAMKAQGLLMKLSMILSFQQISFQQIFSNLLSIETT